MKNDTPRQRRALYIFCSQRPSGAEFVFERLLLFNRHSVQPIALCPPGLFADRLRKQGIKVITTRALLSLNRQQGKSPKSALLFLALSRALRAGVAIARAVRAHDIDIVHANNVGAAAYALLPQFLFRLASRRKVAWLWTTQDKKYLVARDDQIARLCCARLDATIAVSQSVADEYPAFAAKMHVIFSGLDENQWQYDAAARAAFRGRYVLDETTIAIGLIGVVSERKGHHVLIPAFEQLLGLTERKVRLFLIGSTVPQYESYMRHWQAETVRLGLAEQVTWTGQIGDMGEVYAGLDVVVNSTISQYGEPLGTTIYEAMACRRIVLATRTGGSPEIIEDGIDGFLCEPDSTGALARRLAFIAEHWEEMAEVRVAAREKVLRQFTVGEMAAGYIGVYEELLSGEA